MFALVHTISLTYLFDGGVLLDFAAGVALLGSKMFVFFFNKLIFAERGPKKKKKLGSVP